jgi:hypothetical protein
MTGQQLVAEQVERSDRRHRIRLERLEIRQRGTRSWCLIGLQRRLCVLRRAKANGQSKNHNYVGHRNRPQRFHRLSPQLRQPYSSKTETQAQNRQIGKSSWRERPESGGRALRCVFGPLQPLGCAGSLQKPGLRLTLHIDLPMPINAIIRANSAAAGSAARRRREIQNCATRPP